MDAKKLVGHWYHSWEEDQGDRIVYRGPSYAFPPSRAARDTFAFSKDGQVKLGRPGPADASLSGAATWVVDDDLLRVTAPGREDVFIIESADEEVLILRRQRTKEESDGK